MRYDNKIPVKINKKYPKLPTKIPHTQKVEVINQVVPEKIVFPEVQKVEITNPVKEKEVQKVEIINKQELPEVQKVEVINQPKINNILLPEVQKVEVTNPAPVQKIEIPIGKGNIPGQANPEEYVPVRLTDGTKFYKALQDAYVSASATGNKLLDVTHTNTHTGNDELRVYQENHVCTQNTTTTPLGAGETFTGEWQDCLNYQEVNVSVVASHNSATNGLVFQWSADGTIIGDTDVFSYYASLGGTNYTPNPAFRYVRIVYTNGATPQTSFSLQTILRRSVTGGSFHRIDSTLRDDQDGRLQIVVPKLRTAANNYISQTATNAGNAKVSLEEVNGYEPTDYEAKQLTVGLTQVEVTFTGKTKQILIQADHSNTGSIWLGKTGVTISTGAPRLMAGEAVEISYNDETNALYAISDTASQKINISTTIL